MKDEIDHWQTVHETLRSYRRAQVLIATVQLGIFRLLAGGPQSAPELATGSGADPRALRRLLDAAVAMELLVRNDGLYANSPLAETCLAQEAPYYLGNLVSREGAFYRRWAHLTEAVRSGVRPPENVQDEEQENWVRDFELALLDLARAAGPAVAEALAPPGDRPLRVLDVGGGHGGYSMALARRYPNVEATVFELPAAAEVAREIIAGEGLSDRVSVQSGDFQKEDLGRGYDLILLFGVLASETPQGKVALLRKCYEALVPGGRLAVRGFWRGAEPAGSLREALFSLHILLSTDAGEISTLSELEGWLAEVGFEAPHRLSLPTWIGSAVYVARKPT